MPAGPSGGGRCLSRGRNKTGAPTGRSLSYRPCGAVILGAMACALALQSRVPLLSFTAGAFAGAGVALGLGVNTGYEAVRVGVALAMGAVVGFAAERLAGMIGARRV